MGGYGCGGQNQTHGCTSQYRRIDSFQYGKHIPIMERDNKARMEFSLNWSDGSSAIALLYPDRLKVRYSAEQDGERKVISDAVYFDAVGNNYGGERYYFICPFCGRRSRILYMSRLRFMCRLCARLNYHSQQVTDGAYAAAHKLDQFLKNKFGIMENLTPHEASFYLPGKPKGMHLKTYERLMCELHELQEQYDRAWMAGISQRLGANWYR